jgi:hypothetical protein
MLQKMQYSAEIPAIPSQKVSNCTIAGAISALLWSRTHRLAC